MLLSASVFVGVDPTAAHKAFTFAALDRELNILRMAEGELDEILDFVASNESVVVAVNSPSHLNAGLFRRATQNANPDMRNLRGVDLRVAEHELRERGIQVSGTASREALCSGWVRLGLTLYAGMAVRGFEPFPDGDCPQQWLETHPQAAYCALLGRTPLSRVAIEGRLQRQLILYEHGLRMPDPMSYFEEITRHRLLQGILPSELVYLPEQLDALVAALTAWTAVQKQNEVTRVGNDEEGYICLPTASLQDKYQ